MCEDCACVDCSPSVRACSLLLPAATRTAKWKLDRTNSVYEANFNVAYLIGPGIGGVLIATIGAVNTLWVTAAGFVFSIVVVAFIRLPGAGVPEHEHRPKSIWHGTLDGLRFVWNNKLLRTLALIDMAVVALYMPVESVVFPVYFTELDQPAQLGSVLMALAIGGIIGFILLLELALVVATWTTAGEAGDLRLAPNPGPAVTNTRALGAILYELLTGEMLYQVADLSSVWVIADVFEQEPPNSVEGEEYLEFCLDFARRHQVDLLVAARQAGLLADNRHRFAEIGVKLMVAAARPHQAAAKAVAAEQRREVQEVAPDLPAGRRGGQERDDHADQRGGQFHVLGADQDPHDRVAAAVVDQVDQPLDQLFVERPLAGDELARAVEQHPRAPFDQGAQQGVAVGEVPIHRGTRDPGLPADIVHRRLGNAVAQDHLFGGAQDLLTRLVGIGTESGAALAASHVISRRSVETPRTLQEPQVVRCRHASRGSSGPGKTLGDVAVFVAHQPFGDLSAG